jgi:peptidoglycan/LPS O-acetylase OafA/YrhL
MLWVPAAPTLWFISMMMLFYFITPWLRAQADNPLRFLICVLLLCCALYAYGELTHKLDYRLLRYGPMYACGLYIGRNAASMLKLPLWIPLTALPFTFLFGSKSFFYHSDSSIELMPSLLTASVAIFLMLMRIYQQSTTPRLISTMSYASYFMYLFHRPIFALMIRSWFPSHGALQIAYLVVCCLPVICITSYVGQLLYDKAVS